MTVTGLSIPWCCPSVIYAVFLCDDYRLLFLVVWFLATYRDGRRGRTMITCDAWRLTIKVPSGVWGGYWAVAIRIRSICVLCMIYHASSCSLCFQMLGFVSPDPQSASSTRIRRAVLTSDLWSLICVWKLIALFYHSNSSVVMAECARTNLIFTSFNDVPSLVCVVF